jgi:hypothetical protein
MRIPGRKPSAVRLREHLAAHGNAMRMYQTEPLYRAEVEWTFRLLDVIDEVTDAEAAERITAAIGGRLTGDDASEAAIRVRAAQAEFARLVWEGVPG